MRSKCAVGTILCMLVCFGLGGSGGHVAAERHANDDVPRPTSRPVVGGPVIPCVSVEVRMVGLEYPPSPWKSGEPAHELNPRRVLWRLLAPEETRLKALRVPDALVKAANGRTPELLMSFEGNSNEESGGVYPPDIVGDVGPNHYVQMTNASQGSLVGVFDKAGNLAAPKFILNDLWAGSGRPCEGFGYGDPIVLYDSLADRWLLTEFAIPNSDGLGYFTAPYYLCIAVSRTPDPAGEYYLYDFEIPDTFPDYPKYGVWPDAYYAGTNQDPAVGAYAFDRIRMLAGEAATYQYFGEARNFMLPSDLDGLTRPPAGSPNYFYTMMDDEILPSYGFPGVDRLEIWEFHADFDNPDHSTFTHALDLPTSPFNFDVGGDSWEAIPQMGTGQRLDAIGEWPMWRLQYRNFGAYETLVGCFTVDVDGLDHAGIRWFELRKSGDDTWAIHQEGTHTAPDTLHRWMGSVAMNGKGDIALGYSISGRTMYPSIRVAVRTPSDPLGTLGDEISLMEGLGAQEVYDRWGDYSAMVVDPTDDATFWYTNEYCNESGDWQTRVGAFYVSLPAPHPGDASDIHTEGFTANWMAVVGATGYRLQVSEDSAFGTSVPGFDGLDVDGATSWEVNGLTPGTQYHYRVLSYNAEETSAYSEGIGVATTVFVEASDGTSRHAVWVSWGEVPGATEYDVYRNGEDRFASAERLATMVGASYADFTAEPPSNLSGFGCQPSLNYVSYYYWVVPVDGPNAGIASGPDRGYRGGLVCKQAAGLALPQRLGDGLVFAAMAGIVLWCNRRRVRPLCVPKGKTDDFIAKSNDL